MGAVKKTLTKFPYRINDVKYQTAGKQEIGR